MTTRSSDAPPTQQGDGERVPAGVPIDRDPRPAWVADHLTPAQLNIDVGLQWITLLEMAKGMGTTAKAAAACIYRSTVGRSVKKSILSIRGLCDRTDTGSQTTMVKAIKRLITDGWLLREERGPGRRLAAERPGQAGVGYRMAWPVRDCLTPSEDGPQRCGHLTDRGGMCTSRAGKGTTHRGRGPCWRHGGDRANTATDDPAPPAQTPPEPAAEDDSDPPMLHLVEHSSASKPVDNQGHQPPLLQVVASGMLQRLVTNAPTVNGGMLQPLSTNAPAVGVEDATSSLSEFTTEETRGVACDGAEVEGTPRRASDGRFESDSARVDGLTIERAHQILEDLTPVMRAYHLSRAGMDLRHAGTPEPSPDQLVLVAAANVRRSA